MHRFNNFDWGQFWCHSLQLIIPLTGITMTNLNQKKIYNLQTIKDYDSSKIDVIYFAGELVSYNLSWHYNMDCQ